MPGSPVVLRLRQRSLRTCFRAALPLALLVAALLTPCAAARATGLTARLQADAPAAANAAAGKKPGETAKSAANTAAKAGSAKNRKGKGSTAAVAGSSTASASDAAPAPLELEPLCAGDTIDDRYGKLDAKLGVVEGLIHLPADDPGTDALVEVVNDPTGEQQVLSALDVCSVKSAAGLIYRAAVAPGLIEVTLSRPHTAENESCELRGSRCVVDHVKVQAVAAEARRADLILAPQARSVNAPRRRGLWAVPLLFLIILVSVRYNNVAVPTRRGLIVAIRNVRARLRMANFAEHSGPIAELNELLKEDTPRERAVDFLWWSRGWENAGWRVLHQAEIRLVASFSAEETDARLLATQQMLTEMNTPAALGMLARVKDALVPPPVPANTAPAANGAASGAAVLLTAPVVSLATRQALLAAAMDYVSDRDDTDFSTLTSWQNKASWLTMTGILLILGLAFSAGHPELFLAGAAGGFLSRLMRQLKRADVPSDYGASWSTMFLSPVSGSLGGWFGVLILMMLASPKIGLLGPLLAVDWDTTSLAWLLALAFVLGFSERLFDSLLAAAEDTIDKKKVAADTAAVPTPDPAVPPAAGKGKDNGGENNNGGGGDAGDNKDKGKKNTGGGDDGGHGAEDPKDKDASGKTDKSSTATIEQGKDNKVVENPEKKDEPEPK